MEAQTPRGHRGSKMAPSAMQPDPKCKCPLGSDLKRNLPRSRLVGCGGSNFWRSRKMIMECDREDVSFILVAWAGAMDAETPLPTQNRNQVL